MALRPYSVRSPQFNPVSGGIRALYGFYGALLMKGQIALLNATFENSNFVGVYPEIYHGNDMGANTVVRYVMQTPGVMATMGVAGPSTSEIQATSDHIYVFSKIYDTFGVDDDHILFCPILNLHVFKDQKKKKRNKTCYLVGKGVDKCKHPSDSIELTREFALDQQALANLLNECHTLYGYDRLSAMYDLARLCGCKVKYYGDFSRDEMALYETGLNGLAIGGEDVTLDTTAFEEHYREMIKTFDRKLDLFIERTQL